MNDPSTSTKASDLNKTEDPSTDLTEGIRPPSTSKSAYETQNSGGLTGPTVPSSPTAGDSEQEQGKKRKSAQKNGNGDELD
ncbi:hypothetical protein BCR34DRAFT_606955 [Clohesyomyces aquaticus]|uniref:Uncharacterized protein n=1 Tax=Clohesyomyces aquaticus TaxID=1231657 RepID=A0A1Y1YK32_9PLEO|nr:hypothetical protein BCR34DRAFT_606955 [Clohesyomyces aquaticus]